ncbi:hypothetical protein RhiirA1_389237 [Rhizophagus irregularis]|uniref:Uncharacterized protein n=2 Tax=Rhizophagus irregularis TaxID=588596 RepID=A0A2N0SBY1_9GLOM|nr:hypothetical protein RirG_260440 [Rhizophagus irregularis DAOM 197198w]PKC73065.1 hypothetical protein RhiirA1_389237 [Rhizophagus irregularis]GBC29711.1 hypothetical protein RIR_jg27958.t1 [Rhizophagus irregularis DAOM 181602=DAOM 197198]UZO00080.1 hypothetical protein OCT59_001334 [Rhizophagus irregularis]CAB4487227.1 unnamed protein product [Rhizophagus irregularis]
MGVTDSTEDVSTLEGQDRSEKIQILEQAGLKRETTDEDVAKFLALERHQEKLRQLFIYKLSAALNKPTMRNVSEKKADVIKQQFLKQEEQLKIKFEQQQE